VIVILLGAWCHQGAKDAELIITTSQKKGKKIVTTVSGLKGFGTLAASA
jgi:translation initiation factor 1 (eIF-1/SUI1)